MSILEKIVAYKRLEVSENKKKNNLQSLMEKKGVEEKRDFIGAIRHHSPAIIAEIKKASPSKGIICEDFDPVAIAKSYEQHGASCLSVLTDKHFFKGDPSYLALAKANTKIPILRKDFIIDPYQIEESVYLGADCILLIVAILDDIQLQDFCEQAKALELAVLVETHDPKEFDRAIKLPTPLIGVNNRNLHTFETNLKVSIELQKQLPSDKILISESGIESAQDLSFLQTHAINAFLIGETLMRAKNPGLKLAELLHGI